MGRITWRRVLAALAVALFGACALDAQVPNVSPEADSVLMAMARLDKFEPACVYGHVPTRRIERVAALPCDSTAIGGAVFSRVPVPSHVIIARALAWLERTGADVFGVVWPHGEREGVAWWVWRKRGPVVAT